MKAQELRIGNWVRGVYNKQPFQVYPMWFKQLPTDKDHNLIVNNWEPIPLTEQWLIDFGFEKKSWFTKGIVIECVYYQLADLIVYLVDDFFEIEVVTKAGQFNLFKKWNHVHQLQNLYFALSGEELQL